MKITHNISALNTINRFNNSIKNTGSSLEKLSSGLRINRAADDAAGLAISEKMRAQIRGLNQATRNIQDGISVIQTAESGFQEITNIIQRQRELLIQGLNETYTLDDKRNIEREINELTKEIDSIANRTGFNNINLLARDDYQILEDRSSHNVDVTTSGPFPPTVTNLEQFTYFFPIGTTDVPLTVQTSNTETTINDVYFHDAYISPITSPDGRQGYTDYEKNEHIHTETTATNEYSYGRILESDPRYKELDVKYLSINNVFFQTKLIPTATLAGEYPDFGGFEDRFTVVEIDGISHTLDNFTLTSSNITSNTISATYEKDGIEIEKVMSTDGVGFTAEYIIKNSSGIDKQVKFSTVFQPEYNGAYSISSSSGVPVGGTALTAEIPDSDVVFELSNDLVSYDFSFLHGESYLKPESLKTGSSYLQSGNSGPHVITPTWENTDFEDGATIKFGISLSNFNFKKDVYHVTNKTTRTIDPIVETVTTNIKDIDYIPPKLNIQIGANGNEHISIPLYSVKADSLGIMHVGILPPAIPEESIARTDRALTRVTNYRTIYGALQNRLEYAKNNVGNYAENLLAAESRIRDIDMAKEMMDFTKATILTQTSQAMLAQANQNPHMILQLLK
ncbi:flagellin [Alkalihalobacterium elongatum]|uniref:flagellin n=1 Tax=Alkalihalobacterium elongatum TaxID=2675466 RepID=UPI002E29A900|nr:flagellin [Alkalihalobacterium elongatum]